MRRVIVVEARGDHEDAHWWLYGVYEDMAALREQERRVGRVVPIAHDRWRSWPWPWQWRDEHYGFNLRARQQTLMRRAS